MPGDPDPQESAAAEDEGEDQRTAAGLADEGADDLGDDDGSDEGSEEPDEGTRRIELIVNTLAAAALVLSAVSILASIVVVNVLRRGLAAAGRDDAALLGQVNPWYAAAIGTFLAALALLVAWGVMRLRRPAIDRRGPGAVPAGIGLAFAVLAWAFSFYSRLE